MGASNNQLRFYSALELFFVGLFLTSLFLFLPSAVRAQEREGFVLNRFRPAPTTEDGLVLQMPETLGHLRWSAQLVLDYTHSPLVLRQVSTGDEVGDIVGDSLTGHVTGALGIGKRTEVHLVIPVVLFQDGEDGLPASGGAGDPDVFGFGQPVVGGSVRVLGSNELSAEEFKLGVAASVALPIGSEDALASDGGVQLLGKATLARPVLKGNLIPVASLGVKYRPSRDFETVDIGSELLFSVGAHSLLADEALRLMAELYGTTGFRSGTFFGRLETPVELLLGARYTLPMGISVGGAIGSGFTEAVGDPNFRVLLSAGYAPPRPKEVQKAPPKDEEPVDSDGDGIIDPEDACPHVPEDFDGFEDEDGCPRT